MNHDKLLRIKDFITPVASKKSKNVTFYSRNNLCFKSFLNSKPYYLGIHTTLFLKHAPPAPVDPFLADSLWGFPFRAQILLAPTGFAKAWWRNTVHGSFLPLQVYLTCPSPSCPYPFCPFCPAGAGARARARVRSRKGIRQEDLYSLPYTKGAIKYTERYTERSKFVYGKGQEGSKHGKFKDEDSCFKERFLKIVVPKIFWYSISKTSYTIVRPLINFSRYNITMACVLFFLPVYPDLSNLKIRYSRNRIRKQVIPTIQFFFNPKVEKALFQFSEFYNRDSFGF